ncbi:AMP-binding protein [Vibrio gazogenes]|uniref:Long-chain acyl-CoA synthetase (AMP-forming) n=1 Tax=Vibrio gazogenes DSM 21264 = NBRC 103151 TaxID=1123492 RepID=A0A1M4SQN7_VIBGA|nr:AMP-binding protein [Vibrio gazogenes]USP15926.1 AMP-binding protein [Vibrio gazogenes]SHE34502.1 Long-chain acyl-CoA synthetase (AMP-forming) [Vibrio gazogenes DSM 21264] [Vibrio gazogenes DSM 21264 = NBRC 103151]
MSGTILSALFSHASQCPDAIAFIGQNSLGEPETLTFQQLSEQVCHYAGVFSELQSHCIAIYAENSLSWLIADLAAMYAQIPCVPLPKFFSSAQIEHVLSLTGTDTLIYDQPLQGFESCGELQECAIGRRSEFNHAFGHSHCVHGGILPGTVKITFTSGSTGQPKGVCLSQQNLDQVTSSLAQEMVKQSDLEKHLVMLPLSTLLENITGVYVPLVLGLTSVVLNGESVGLQGSSQFTPEQFAGALIKYQPNSLVLTPALLHALIAVTRHLPQLAASLRFVAVGGARVTPQTLVEAHRLGLPVYEGYGLSECGSVVSLNTPDANSPGTAGKILPHAEVRITDDGEILVRGAVALGYINQPLASEWVETGDLGHVNEQGFLSVQGRKKNQIITGFGRNISPEWIESESQQWDVLRSLIVVGEAKDRLMGVVLSQDVEKVTAAIVALNRQLPDYAHVCQVLLVLSPQEYRALLTANGRPKRHLVEEQVNLWCNDIASFENVIKRIDL